MKYLLQLTLICLLIIPASKLSADHIVGADITWKCTENPNQYEFVWTQYLDCNEIVLEPNLTPGTLNFTCAMTSGPPPTSGQWTQVGPHVDVTPLCPFESTDCNGGNIPGVHQFTWSNIYTFGVGAPSCGLYNMDWTTCCRNYDISSVSPPQGLDVITEGYFRFEQGICNEGPVFNAPAYHTICNNQTAVIPLGAPKYPGVRYEHNLMECWDNEQGQQVPPPYLSGFSMNKPLGPTWNVILDHAFGTLVLTPDAGGGDLETGIICIRVDKYRDQTLLGSTTRHIQIRVRACDNELPTLSGIDGTSSFSTNVCVGEKTCFDIYSSDPDLGDVLTVGVVQNLPGAEITMSSGPFPVTTVCWTPTQADLGLNVLSLDVADDACPAERAQQFDYTIFVDTCPPADSCEVLNLMPNFDLLQDGATVTINNISTGTGITSTEYHFEGSAPQIFPGNHSAPVSHTFSSAGDYTVCVRIVATGPNGEECEEWACKIVTVEDCDFHDASWQGYALSHSCTFRFFDTSTPGSSSTI
ncbi:MAG: hypothetical protein AAF570_03575, partial [Bacteroidota bacterium]